MQGTKSAGCQSEPDHPLVGRIEFVSFQTVAEVSYGALLRAEAAPASGAWRQRRRAPHPSSINQLWSAVTLS